MGVADHIRQIRRATDRRGDIANIALVAVQLVIHVYLLFALPVLLTHSRWWAISLVFATVVPIPMWILAHEAVHGSLHRNRSVNDVLGRLLTTVCYAAPFELLRIGHLLHHKDNAYGQVRVDPMRPRSRSWYANYYAALFLQPVAPLLASNLVALLPRRWALPIARRLTGPALIARATEPDVYSRIRVEGGITLVIIVVSAITWRTYPAGLACIYVLRCALISFDDSVYHFQGPADPQHGYNLRVPRMLRWLFLGFNHHGVHHVNAGLRWRQLAVAFTNAGMHYDSGYFSVAFNQLRPMTPHFAAHQKWTSESGNLRSQE